MSSLVVFFMFASMHYLSTTRQCVSMPLSRVLWLFQVLPLLSAGNCAFLTSAVEGHLSQRGPGWQSGDGEHLPHPVCWSHQGCSDLHWESTGKPLGPLFPVVGDDCGENRASILIAAHAVRSSTYRGSGSRIFSLHHRNRWIGTMVTCMKQTVVRQLVEADGLVPGYYCREEC